ncbi:MAG: amidohydrolase family protein [Cellulosilyticaceae bacterium]
MFKQSQPCTLLIRDCALLSSDFQVIDHQSIAIEGQRIVAIGPTATIDEDYHSTSVLDGTHKLILPGLIDAHMHTNQQLLRGRITDELPMIWTRIMLPFESTLTPEHVTLSAELAALEMIRSGTTAFADAGGSFMHHAAQVYLGSGLRGALTYSTMDQGNLPPTMKFTKEAALARNLDLHQTYHNQNEGCLQVFFSLRSLLSCSSQLIEESFHLAKELGTGVHMHMNEYANEIYYCLEHFQKRPFEYLDSLGVLGGHLLSAHSLFLSESEKQLMKNNEVRVAHCPYSNCGKGVPPTPALLAKSINVGLGTDGTAHGGMSLWNEMRIFRSIMQISHGIATHDPQIMPTQSILHMATQGGAHCLGQGHQLGKIKEGYLADLISIDMDQPHLYPTHNWVNTLVESVSHQDVCDVIVNGKWLMKDRVVLTLDQEKILFNARRYFEKQLS